MKQLRPVILTLTIACMGFLLQNCRKGVNCGDDDDTVTDYKISEGDLQKIPYKGFESLTFVRTTVGDTHTFVGDGWKQYWGLTTTEDDCPQKERYEMRQLIFRSATFPDPISISIYKDQINKATYWEFYFVKTLYETSLLNSPYVTQYDSLYIQSKLYRNVRFISNDNSSTMPTDYGCYYTIDDGILKMYFANGETWELLKQ